MSLCTMVQHPVVGVMVQLPVVVVMESTLLLESWSNTPALIRVIRTLVCVKNHPACVRDQVRTIFIVWLFLDKQSTQTAHAPCVFSVLLATGEAEAEAEAEARGWRLFGWRPDVSSRCFIGRIMTSNDSLG